MCGFVGGTDPRWAYSEALASLAHRGPDASGLLVDEPISIGFRRLKIIDLDDSANQPMLSHDGSCRIAFNGEIYGFERLRRTLEQRGHRFRTSSDTEVVLNAYLEWGQQFVSHIDGMFAIAIWDANTDRLLLYRDRAGIKPLFYFHDGRSFAFASELKALEALLGPDRLDSDPTALYDFLTYRYVPAPKTLYRQCRKLRPGHMLSLEPRKAATPLVQAYWTLEVPLEPEPVAVETAAETVRGLVESSVRDQMIADVPLGFFLSGGVDSSVVVAAASRLRSGITDAKPIETFSIGFDSDAVSETPVAREVARLFSTSHHERILLAEDAGDLLPRLATWFDEPFADESAMPTWLVSKTARERVTVALTGDGGDEVFGGYRTYPRYIRNAAPPSWPEWMDRLSSRIRARLNSRNPLSRLLRLLELRMSSGPALWARIMFAMSPAARASYAALLEIPADYDELWYYRQHWRPELPTRTRLQYLDFHTFLPDLVLTKVDRTSMAVSLEARVPLLARELIEYSFGLPESVRYAGGELKGILKRAFSDLLPRDILDRRKKGFGIPRHYLRDRAAGRPIQAHVLDSLYLSTPPQPADRSARRSIPRESDTEAR